MKYIFPRQFGLHNVFTSPVDPKETAQPFKDYTLREQEIEQTERRALKLNCDKSDAANVKQYLPKRLRGRAYDLVNEIQKLHARCSYHELFNYYCPKAQLKSRERRPISMKRCALSQTSTTLQPVSQVSHLSPSFDLLTPKDTPTPSSPYFVALATPQSNVSAFSRSVLSNLIPNGFWGDGVQGLSNQQAVMHHIDQFIRLRRFESMSLHTVCQDLKVKWLPLEDCAMLISVVESHCVVDASERECFYKNFIFRYGEAPRDIPGVPLLCL